jgi:hypothetical protein
MGQLMFKEPVTPFLRRLFNESPRENIFAIKTARAEFFKPHRGNTRSLGTRLLVGMRSN